MQSNHSDNTKLIQKVELLQKHNFFKKNIPSRQDRESDSLSSESFLNNEQPSIQNNTNKNIYLIGIPLNRQQISETLRNQGQGDYSTYPVLQKAQDILNSIKKITKDISKNDPSYKLIIFSLREYALENKEWACTYQEKQATLNLIKKSLKEKINDERVIVVLGTIPYYKYYEKKTFHNKLKKLKTTFKKIAKRYPDLVDDHFEEEREKLSTKDIYVPFLKNKAYVLDGKGEIIHKKLKSAPFNEFVTFGYTKGFFKYYYDLGNPKHDKHILLPENIQLSLEICREHAFPCILPKKKKKEMDPNALSIQLVVADSIRPQHINEDTAIYLLVDSELGFIYWHNEKKIDQLPFTFIPLQYSLNYTHPVYHFPSPIIRNPLEKNDPSQEQLAPKQMKLTKLLSIFDPHHPSAYPEKNAPDKTVRDKTEKLSQNQLV